MIENWIRFQSNWYAWVWTLPSSWSQNPEKNGGSLSQKSGIAHHEICRPCRISKTDPGCLLEAISSRRHRTAQKVCYQGMSSELDKHGQPLESYFQGTSATHGSRGSSRHKRAGPASNVARPKSTYFWNGSVWNVAKWAMFQGAQPTQTSRLNKKHSKPQKLRAAFGRSRALGNAGFSFVDAAHFVLGVYLSTVWCFTSFVYCSACRAATFQRAWRSGCRDERNSSRLQTKHTSTPRAFVSCSRKSPPNMQVRRLLLCWTMPVIKNANWCFSMPTVGTSNFCFCHNLFAAPEFDWAALAFYTQRVFVFQVLPKVWWFQTSPLQIVFRMPIWNTETNWKLC